MRVYAFFGKGEVFQKFRSLCSAIAAVNGDESRVFVHVEGIPNPWWVHPVKNKRVQYDIVYKEIPKKSFKKSRGLFGMTEEEFFRGPFK